MWFRRKNKSESAPASYEIHVSREVMIDQGNWTASRYFHVEGGDVESVVPFIGSCHPTMPRLVAGKPEYVGYKMYRVTYRRGFDPRIARENIIRRWKICAAS